MPSFLDRLKAQMQGSLGVQVGSGTGRPAPEQVRKSTNTVASNRWDQRVWKEARQAEPIDDLIVELLDGDEHKGGEHKPFDLAPEAVQDLFMLAYKADPQILPKRAVAREAYAVRKIMEELAENPRLQELQEFTAGDAVMSTIAVESMSESVKEIIYRVPPPPPPPQPGAPKGKKGQGQGQPGQGGAPGGSGQGDEEAEGEAEEEEGQGEGQPDPSKPQKPGEGDDPNDEGGGDTEGEGGVDEEGEDDFDPEDVEDDPDEADWEAAYDELLDGMGMDFDVAAALDKAEEEVKELDGLRRGVGLDDGTWQQMSPEERLKMAARLKTPEMRDLANVIGRMRRFALGTRAKRMTDVPHEAYDVETGDKIPLVLRGQFALLGHPDTELEFYRRLADKELLQFKMRGTEDAGKGPIVIAIDKSGSMNGAPFKWAMGVAEALRRFAAEDDRDYYAMFFGSNNDRNRFEFPKGKGPFEKVMSFLSVVANGGTQFDGVLTEALQRAQDAFDGEAKGKADIVFITDGQAALSEKWIKHFNEERERIGVRVYSVFVSGGYDMRYSEGPIKLLDQISDAVIPVSELKPESVEKVFARV